MNKLEEVNDAIALFGNPGLCSNCALYEDGIICLKNHRVKPITISTGRLARVFVRKRGGCTDHVLKDGSWWGYQPSSSTGSDYGGVSTSLF